MELVVCILYRIIFILCSIGNICAYTDCHACSEDGVCARISANYTVFQNGKSDLSIICKSRIIIQACSTGGVRLLPLSVRPGLPCGPAPTRKFRPASCHGAAAHRVPLGFHQLQTFYVLLTNKNKLSSNLTKKQNHHLPNETN
jgi:hypothetical protein